MKQNYQVITLDKKDIGETDRLYIFYTREEGLMTVPAKGIRKSQAKLAAQVEVFNFSNITIAKNRGRGTLTGAISENNFNVAKQNYQALKEIYRARDIFLRIIYGHEVDQNIFDLLLNYLRKIEQIVQLENSTEKIIWLTNAFIFKLYYLQGYTFHFVHCQGCKVLISNSDNNYFSAHSGGVVCPQCSPKINFKNKIDINTIKALRLIIKNDFRNFTKVSVDQKVNNQMSIIGKDVLRWVMR